LPPTNVFCYQLDHLGMPVQLVRDAALFERLMQVSDQSQDCGNQQKRAVQ